MRRLALLALLVPASARAQTAPPRDMKAVCETSRPAPEDYDPCGDYYVGLYAQNPAAPHGDEHLYNAGVYFYEAGSISAAMNAFAQLYRQYPHSKIAAKALARMGKTYGDIVMWDKAAELLEEYAKKYAGEKDAYAAMSDAVFYRRALGQDAKAIENTKYFVKTFGAKKPREAANAHFALTAIYEKQRDSDATSKHLQEYIHVYGNKGGNDRLVIAHAKLGLLRLDASCPVKLIDGGCVRIKRARPGVCAKSTVTYELVKRKDAELKKAKSFLAAAIKQFEKGGGTTDGDEAAARYYYARALLALTDVDAEAALVANPTPRRSVTDWLAEQTKSRASLVARYEMIHTLKDAATSIAAASRLGRLIDSLATGLAGSATKATECAALAEQAAPLHERAKLAYGVCLAKATELGWFDDDARLCERELGRLMPDDYPPLRETTSTPQPMTLTATETLRPSRP